jgi:hypothetical protein
MRVNIIGNLSKRTGVSQDIHIIHGMIAHAIGKETTIRHVPHFFPQCEEAEVNFFIEVINPALFPYASKNIWIPNPEWTYKTWEPYAKMIDEVWVKTKEALNIFSQWNCRVRLIGWTSIDKVFEEKKNYHKAVVPSGKNIWRNPKPIVQAYMKIQSLNPGLYNRLPSLSIVWHNEFPEIPEAVAGKIDVLKEVLSEKDYDDLLHECGLVICMSAAEGYGHAVNEALSTGCIPILSPIEPFLEMTNKAIWVSNKKITPHPQCLGVLEDIDIDSLVESLRFYVEDIEFKKKKDISKAVRDEYETRHQLFVKEITDVLTELFKDIPIRSLESSIPKEDDLPNVSILTITRDRRPFIPLAKYNFIAQTYPQEKLEWIIVDDGKDQIKDLISDLPNIKYVLVDEPLTIGEKRNLGVSMAAYDIIVMMDDDDVYPNNSILSRVAHMLAEPKKECLFSTTIPCYEIHESKSFMNVPPMTLPMSERVSEATLCFTKKFWEAGKFPDKQVGEGDAFIHDREHMCRELSPQDVIVSLVHKKNTSSRKPPSMEEPNGSHYGFSDELFTLISEIGQSI